ncbi:MAG: hypothetical protein ABGX27_02775 [Desulfurobacteriaceae bacterium]
MRVYFGYPESVSLDGTFKIKDLFLKEVGIDYETVPIEVKRKLLSILDNLDKTKYLYLGNIYYDAIDILEFALFGVSASSFREIILPGYLYGKPTFLIRNLFRNSFTRNFSIYYDFNFFNRETLVVNIGYKKTSVSIGGQFVVIIPIGEYHFVDGLGNYLFNRYLLEKRISNTQLRKEGLRGIVLDKFRSFAAKVLFKGSRVIEFDDYKREISEEEIKLAISPYAGETNYGDFVEKPKDLSSSIVLSLYSFEETFKERPPVKEIVLIGRLTFPFKEVLQKIFPIPVKEFKEEELLKASLLNPVFRTVLKKIDFGLDKGQRTFFSCKGEKMDFSLKALRGLFNKRDLKGLYVIEKLVQEQESLGKEEREKFILELLSILKRCTLRRKEDILYLNYSIAALSKVSIPEKFFQKVLDEMVSKAFNWQLPFETKMNILYFCFRFKEKIRDERIKVFLPLLLTYIRDKKLSEGERNFIRTAVSSIFEIDFYRY